MGLRLYRRSGAPTWVRRRASCWTSIGLAAILSVSTAVLFAIRGTDFDNGTRRIGPRQLNTDGYFEDPLIDRPDGGSYNDATNQYWIFVHIIIIAYMLLGLNTVCDLYFTGALDEMVNKWDIKPDVAGATFMAAGGSAPELFTSLIGAVISVSDVGFGTIVGSAVFNVLFVIGLCGFAAQVPIKLSWWPLFRDCSYYIFGLCMLAIFAKTGKAISLEEAIILFVGYLGYCVMMYNNASLEERFVTGKKDPIIVLQPVVPIGHVADTGSTITEVVPIPPDQPPAMYASVGSCERSDHERHHIKKSQPHFERKSMAVAQKHNEARMPSKERKDSAGACAWDVTSSEPARQTSTPEPEERPACNQTSIQIPDTDNGEEEEEDDIQALLERPEGTLPQVLWYLCLPIYAALYFGIPKPTERCFMATFGVSLLYIAGFSFFLVYCVEIIGEVLGIHIIIMGFTLLAAGTSIPDLISSMAVARAGEGDMAVSSSIGSNIFDILVGLPIPWIIKILFVEMMGNGKATYSVAIISDYIVLYVIILVVMVFCVVLSIHMLGWYLNRTLGVGMAMLYAIFLIIVLSVEFSEPEALKF